MLRSTAYMSTSGEATTHHHTPFVPTRGVSTNISLLINIKKMVYNNNSGNSTVKKLLDSFYGQNYNIIFVNYLTKR